MFTPDRVSLTDLEFRNELELAVELYKRQLNRFGFKSMLSSNAPTPYSSRFPNLEEPITRVTPFNLREELDELRTAECNIRQMCWGGVDPR